MFATLLHVWYDLDLWTFDIDSQSLWCVGVSFMHSAMLLSSKIYHHYIVFINDNVYCTWGFRDIVFIFNSGERCISRTFCILNVPFRPWVVNSDGLQSRIKMRSPSNADRATFTVSLERVRVCNFAKIHFKIIPTHSNQLFLITRKLSFRRDDRAMRPI